MEREDSKTDRVQIDDANRWRSQTPGTANWCRTARPDDPNKYLMISADAHANEPVNSWSIVEGNRPTKIRIMAMGGQDEERNGSGATIKGRAADHKRDGIDAEIIFPNKGLAMWATPDPILAMAQCRVWNDWAWEFYGPHNDTMSPMAALATGVLPGTMVEIERTAKKGFRGLTLPCKPI